MSTQHKGPHPTWPADPLVIFIHESTAGVVLRLAGDLDVDTAADLRVAIDASGRGRRRVVLDLAQIEFMDSTGLAALLKANQQMRDRGGELVLRAVPAQVDRLLRLTDLGRPGAPFDFYSIGPRTWCDHHLPDRE